jgi:hypothetical protein
MWGDGETKKIRKQSNLFDGNILCGLYNIRGEGYYQTTGNHRFST